MQRFDEFVANEKKVASGENDGENFLFAFVADAVHTNIKIGDINVSREICLRIPDVLAFFDFLEQTPCCQEIFSTDTIVAPFVVVVCTTVLILAIDDNVIFSSKQGRP